MNYRTLFEMYDEAVANQAPIARSSDPITSHQSAAETESKLGLLQRKFVFVLNQFGKPMTANEVAAMAAEALGGCVESYRKRARELVNAGHIEECGFRPCQITGKNAQTFKARSK